MNTCMYRCMNKCIYYVTHGITLSPHGEILPFFLSSSFFVLSLILFELGVDVAVA